MDETIWQARAAAGRAATVLSKSYLEIPGQVACVDPSMCVACATCVKVCPYGAPMINELHKAEIQGAKCMGCGSCSAECPAKAITLRNYLDMQILAAVDGLMRSLQSALGTFVSNLPLGVLAGVLLWVWRKDNPPRKPLSGLIDEV